MDSLLLTELSWKVRNLIRDCLAVYWPLPTHSYLRVLTRLDPKYEEEVSGCTAAVSIISKHKIWVVGLGCTD